MRKRKLREVQTADGIVVGVKRRAFFQDVYHLFLSKSWPHALAAIVGTFLTLNLLFSFMY